jgi:AraC-like DNA-binding protein
MKNADRHYEGHLHLWEFSVPAGGEWSSPLTGWSVLKVGNGTGYYLQQQVNQELETGSVVMIPDGVSGRIRASQLGALSSYTFSVAPSRLTGLISLSEQQQLEEAAARQNDAVQIFLPSSPAAAKMEELRACKRQEGLLFRLKLLQFFVELLGHELKRTTPRADSSDAKQRLQSILKETPSSELLEMNFHELARHAGCTSRHLGRIFQELVGMSFRDKRAEMRLEKARELLATTDCKILDVAMESGFKSLSLFNLMFARRFGMSPGKWRQKLRAPNEPEAPEKPTSAPVAHGSVFPANPNGRTRVSQKGDSPARKKSLSRIGVRAPLPVPGLKLILSAP